MLLHLGGSWAVNSRRVIGVFDWTNIAGTREARDILRRAAEEKRLERVDDAPPKAMVLLDDARGARRVILTSISAATLRLRLAGAAVIHGFAK
ncbi:MAG: hypothetical protein PHO66_00875 [Eubacteriales bacterium]|nr:hypothetical protein [Eubacteriales bacterium]